MALQTWTTNGYTSSSNWSWRQIIVDDSYSTSNNTSVVIVTTQLKGSYLGGDPNVTIICDGETYKQTLRYNYPTYFNNWTTVLSKTFTIKHNNDGSKNISVSSSWSATGFVPNSCSANGSYNLTTIPRATVAPTVNGYIESSCIFPLSPYASFSHSLQLSWVNSNNNTITKYIQTDGSLGDSEYIFPSSYTNINFNIDSTYYNEFTNSDKLSASLLVKTYSGSKLIGSSTGTFQFVCNPALCNPDITTYEIYDTNSTTTELTKNNLDIVSIASDVRFKPVLRASSTNDTKTTIQRIVIDNIEYIYENAEIDIGSLQKNHINTKIYNSRNMIYETSLNIKGNLIPYFQQTFSISRLYRVEPTTGEIAIKYSGTVFNDYFDKDKTNKNNLNIVWKYREKNETTFINGGTLIPTYKDNTYYGEASLGKIFDYNKQYVFQFTINDSITTLTTEPQNVARGYPVYWWNSKNFYVNGNIYSNDFNLSNIGKTIRLCKNKTQSLPAKNINIITWEKTLFDNTEGLVTSDGSYITIGPGVHIVNIEAYYQNVTKTTKYIYLRVQRTRQEENELVTIIDPYCTVNTTENTLHISQNVYVEEGDSLYIEAYSEIESIILADQSWTHFTVTIIR